MNVFYSFNDAYATLAGISIYSLLENTKDCQNINIYIVDSGISEQNKQKIQKMVDLFGQKAFFVEMPSFEKVLGISIDAGRWNINVYSKLFAASILPVEVDKIISIDCDTIIMHSLKELWDINLNGAVVAGVNECMSQYYRRNLGKQDKDHYFNSGMLVLNLEEFRKGNYEELFWKYMKRYGSSLAYLDQDLVNAVVPQQKMLLLDPKYNAITPIFCLDYRELIRMRNASIYYAQDKYIDAQCNPYIIHFTTFFMNELRPWIEGSKHPKLDEFLKYKERSPWADEKMWKDKRDFKTKMKYKCIRLIPRFLLIKVVAFLHGRVVPSRNLKKMKKAAKLAEE